MLLCFIVILFICVVVGVIKYSTAHSLKQEKDIKLSTIDNEKFTRLGSIDQNGSMVINEANNARFLELGKEYDKCNGCCWLPQCLICNCPLSHARGKDMRCLKDFSGDAYLNETVWNSFLQKKHIDLCN